MRDTIGGPFAAPTRRSRRAASVRSRALKSRNSGDGAPSLPSFFPLVGSPSPFSPPVGVGVDEPDVTVSGTPALNMKSAWRSE